MIQVTQILMKRKYVGRTQKTLTSRMTQLAWNC
jgi:hypothetical protein